MHTVTITVNGRQRAAVTEARKTLADFLREDIGLTGTHLGCEHGVCGACTIWMDGEAVRSCLLFAVQADGSEITTIEGLAPAGEMHPVQQAFQDQHGLQCGFCTPGFVMSAAKFLEEHPNPDERTIRTELSGNICRCTGYQAIVAAVQQASQA